VLLSLYVLFAPDSSAAPRFSGSDKVVHLALFALLAGTARWRFGPLRAVVIAVLAYAALSEVVQRLLLEHRSGDLRDLLADAIGVAIGWVVAGRLLTRR
jgi:VanZ family protein